MSQNVTTTNKTSSGMMVGSHPASQMVQPGYQLYSEGSHQTPTQFLLAQPSLALSTTAHRQMHKSGPKLAGFYQNWTIQSVLTSLQGLLSQENIIDFQTTLNYNNITVSYQLSNTFRVNLEASPFGILYRFAYPTQPEQLGGLLTMETFEISKTMRQTNSEAVAILIAIVQVVGAFGRRALQNGGRMQRERGLGSALIKRASVAHPFCIDVSL